MRRVSGVVMAVVLAVVISSFFHRPGEQRPEAVKAAVASPLVRQAAAVGRDDVAAWLAPVDPPLRPRYRDLFRTLRALRVGQARYRIVDGRLPALRVELAYCFQDQACTAEAPRITQRLTFRGSTVITAAEAAGAQPLPWENGDLVFAQGRRVTVGAPRALRGRMAEVVALADQAAAIDDRYAAMVGNRQPRYRLYLAGDRQWRTWYGGPPARWAVGYMRTLGGGGGDVVINPARIHGGRSGLRQVIQHELGHVATIGGIGSRPEDKWLVEGVAEYIGAQPQPATATPSRQVLRPVTTMAAAPPADGARDGDVAAFYAEGHFAVACLVAAYGEPRAMEFVRLRLRKGDSLENAARSVFGRRFATVDRSCARWMRNQVFSSNG
jgi:hypothetical protein